MKNIKYIILSGFLIISTLACEGVVDDINENPNEISSDNFDAGVLLLKGIEIANIGVQLGHQTRIGSMWSGQTRGVELLYKSIFEYNLSAEETNGIWQNTYQGIVKQARTMREQTASDPKAKQYAGISKVIEAQALGTLASLFGDIPFTEISSEVANPRFDGQRTVLAGVQSLLDEAIADLNASTSSPIAEDIYYNGNKTKWLKAAYTIKARFYILTREYDQALAAAKNGILAKADACLYIPPNIGLSSTNLNFKMVNERGGYWDFTGSYLETILKTTRNNEKTNEAARLAYYDFDGLTANNNKGIAAIDRPMSVVGFEENLLYLAEAEARVGSLDEALKYLNQLRAHLAAGDAFTPLNATDSLNYAPYVLEDFNAGGIENQDNKDQKTALLREIIEERYVTCFTQLMPFEDLRRLSAKEPAIAVLPPFNTANATKYPQRFVIAQSELSANINAPSDPGIFAETEINK